MYTINSDILTSAAAAGDSSSEAFASALSAAQGSFDSYDEAYAAYTALVQAVDGEAPAEMHVTAARNEDGSITLTWDAKDDVTYTITREEK